MAEISARPEQYPLLGALGRAVAKADEFARKPFGYENPPAAIISDLLQIPALTRTAENINYGSPLTHGTSSVSKYLPRLNKDTVGAIEGAVNFIPAVGPLARATKAGVRAAAPYAAKQALDVTERFGVSPMMNVVKPVGNLNLRPSVLASQLKGPEKQKVGDFIKQINGMKGLTKEGKEGALASLKKMDQNAVVTKDYVENAFEPSKYNIVDLKGAADDAMVHLENEAEHMTENDPELWEKFAEYIGVADDPHAAVALDLLVGESDLTKQFVKETLEKVSPETRAILKESGIIMPNGMVNANELGTWYDEFHFDLFDTNFEYLRTNADDLITPGDYAHRDYQRLLADTYDPDTVGAYVEKGVAHPDAPASYRHYPESDEPLTSHFRGTGGGARMRMPDDGDIRMDPNSFLIEELQSDANKIAPAAGILHQPHATAFKAAVQHALEQGHDTVYMPTARTIAHIRPSYTQESFAPIYDQEVVRHGIEPLSRMEGVSVEPVTYEAAEGPATAYHKIKISPEARKEILEGQGQSLPGFAGGGSVDAPTFNPGDALLYAMSRYGAR
jgi:hypothetical protein